MWALFESLLISKGEKECFGDLFWSQVSSLWIWVRTVVCVGTCFTHTGWLGSSVSFSPGWRMLDCSMCSLSYSGVLFYPRFFFFPEEDLPWANICCQSPFILYVGHCHNMATNEGVGTLLGTEPGPPKRSVLNLTTRPWDQPQTSDLFVLVLCCVFLFSGFFGWNFHLLNPHPVLPHSVFFVFFFPALPFFLEFLLTSCSCVRYSLTKSGFISLQNILS